MSDAVSAPLALATEFPARHARAVAEAGRARAQGRAVRETLVARTADGLAIQPLYPRAPPRSRDRRARAGARWQVMAAHRSSRSGRRQRAGAAGARERRRRARAGRRRVGRRARLRPRCRRQTRSSACSMASISTPASRSSSISARRPRICRSHSPRWSSGAALRPDAVDIRFGFDPLGAAALNGGFPLPWAQFAPLAAKLARRPRGAGIRTAHRGRRRPHRARRRRHARRRSSPTCWRSRVAYLRALRSWRHRAR